VGGGRPLSIAWSTFLCEAEGPISLSLSVSIFMLQYLSVCEGIYFSVAIDIHISFCCRGKFLSFSCRMYLKNSPTCSTLDESSTQPYLTLDIVTTDKITPTIAWNSSKFAQKADPSYWDQTQKVHHLIDKLEVLSCDHRQNNSME
jgi:hypothetical protein